VARLAKIIFCWVSPYVTDATGEVVRRFFFLTLARSAWLWNALGCACISGGAWFWGWLNLRRDRLCATPTQPVARIGMTKRNRVIGLSALFMG